MTFFFQLYQAITLPILSKWVCCCHLAKLDSACCNHEQRRYLKFLYSRCVLTTPYTNTYNIAYFFRWLTSKGLKLSFVVLCYEIPKNLKNVLHSSGISTLEIPAVMLNKIAPKFLQSVRHLRIDNWRSVKFSLLKKLESMTIPFLDMLDFDETIETIAQEIKNNSNFMQLTVSLLVVVNWDLSVPCCQWPFLVQAIEISNYEDVNPRLSTLNPIYLNVKSPERYSEEWFSVLQQCSRLKKLAIHDSSLQRLDGILHRCSQITSLAIGYCPIDDMIVVQLLLQRRIWRSLSIYCMEDDLSESMWELLLLRFEKVISLELFPVFKLSNWSFSLRDFNHVSCYLNCALGPESLQRVFKGQPHLTCVTVLIGHMTDDALETLFKYCPALHELNVKGVFDIKRTVQTLLEHYAPLRSLAFKNNKYAATKSLPAATLRQYYPYLAQNWLSSFLFTLNVRNDQTGESEPLFPPLMQKICNLSVNDGHAVALLVPWRLIKA